MKKTAITLLFLFAITLVAAAPTLQLPDTTQPGETLLGKITLPSGEEFTEQVTLQNIEFLEGRKSIFVEHDIIFYNGVHYLYAYMPRQGNFTLKISNVLYKSADTLQSKNFEQKIIVKENPIIIQEEKINETTNETYYENKSTTEIFSVKPGFFFGTSIPEFTLRNKGLSDLNITVGEQDIFLQADSAQKFTPTIPQNQTLFFIDFQTYQNFSIPIIYLFSESIFPEESLIILKAVPQYLHVNLIANQEKIETIELFNFAEQNITDISVSKNLSIVEIENEDELESIDAKSTKNISLTFNSELEGFSQGEITLQYKYQEQQHNLTIPILVYISSENSTEQVNVEDFIEFQSDCEKEEGLVCPSGTSCSGEETYTGVFCCFGTCEQITYPNNNSKGGYGWLIGILIILVLGVAGFFVYKKFKKTTPVAPEQKLQKTTEDYNTRISGGLSRG